MNDLTCAEFVELVTAFLDGILDADSERRFVDHCPTCPGCQRYLYQFQQTIRLLGAFGPPYTLESTPRR